MMMFFFVKIKTPTTSVCVYVFAFACVCVCVGKKSESINFENKIPHLHHSCHVGREHQHQRNELDRYESGGGDEKEDIVFDIRDYKRLRLNSKC